MATNPTPPREHPRTRSETQRLRAPAIFPPFAPRPEDVPTLLCNYISTARGESGKSSKSGDANLAPYHALEAGYHYIFERELSLPFGNIQTGDDDVKRRLDLLGAERLTRAVPTTEEALRVLGRILERGRVEVVKAFRLAGKKTLVRTPLQIDLSGLVQDAALSSTRDVGFVAAAATGAAGTGAAVAGAAISSPTLLIASWKLPLKLNLSKLRQVSNLAELHTCPTLDLRRSLGSCALIGGGGGSDVIQAGAIARLLARASAEPTVSSTDKIKIHSLTSVRAKTSKSTSFGSERSVWSSSDPKKLNLLRTANGCLKIEPDHVGNARFVEDAISKDFDNLRLVIDDKSQGGCSERYQPATQGAESLIVVDTGGDVLGGIDASSPTGKKTPDQDLRTQLDTSRIATAEGLDALVAIAAIGVDAPSDTQQKLENSQAVRYKFSAEDKTYLRRLYTSWNFDGSAQSLVEYPEHYGKTPFSMLASFGLPEGVEGRFVALPLPRAVIDDWYNPWLCVQWVTPEMGGLVFASQKRLLGSIGVEM